MASLSHCVLSTNTLARGQSLERAREQERSRRVRTDDGRVLREGKQRRDGTLMEIDNRKAEEGIKKNSIR